MLDELETFVTAYVKRRFRPNLAQSIAITSYELCANAISYASVSTDIGFELWIAPTSVEVKVVNQAVPARVEQLRQMLERIDADPEGTYLSEMRRSISGRMPRAMLGLARVAHEAGMHLELLLEGRQVQVSARCKR